MLLVEQEKKLQIIDIIVTIIIFVIACLAGKHFLDIYDTWISFNGPALGIVGIGELIWMIIRKLIIRKWNKAKQHKGES